MSRLANMTPPTAQPILKSKGHNVRALLTVLAIMAFLAGLAILFSRATLRLSGDWQSQLRQSMTIQITLSPLSAENDFVTQMAQAATQLEALLGPNTEVSQLSRSESNALLRPWIGNLDLPDSLTLPGLITVTRNDEIPFPNIETLEASLLDQGIIAAVDDHTRWSDQIDTTARSLVIGSFTLLSLLLIASLSVNLFATRASMAAQQSIISVLAQVGASDRFIAKLFVMQAGWRSALGASIGLTIAWAVWLCSSLLGLSDDIFWQSLKSVLSDSVWLFGLWIIFILICATAAGVTTKYALIQGRKRA